MTAVLESACGVQHADPRLPELHRCTRPDHHTGPHVCTCTHTWHTPYRTRRTA